MSIVPSARSKQRPGSKGLKEDDRKQKGKRQGLRANVQRAPHITRLHESIDV